MRKFIAVALALAAVPLFATDPNPTKKQRELIAEMNRATNNDELMISVMDSMFAEMQKAFLAEAEANGNTPAQLAEAKERFERFRELALKMDLTGTLNESLVRLYAKYFTEQELAELIAFYKSPAGMKAIEVMPRLMQEAMSIGVKEVTPKLEEIGRQVELEFEKKFPWRRTMKDMREIATALEAYAIDQDDETYPRGDFASLKPMLEPDYIKKLPETDVWGHAYAYIASSDAKHYRVVSAGADGIFEWDSRRAGEIKEGAETRIAERLEDDIIYGDGMYIQQPKAARE